MNNNTIMIIVFYICIFVALMLPLYLTNRRKKKNFQNLMASLKIGDKIVTIGGIHGEIVKIEAKKVLIKVDKGVSIWFSKEAIAREEK